MIPDWTRLEPYRPLDPGDPAYVERPSGGARLAEWIHAGKSAVLVAGTVGIGKSTELSQAAKLLEIDGAACLIPLDRLENMRRITAESALLKVAGHLAQVAISQLSLDLSEQVRYLLASKGLLPDQYRKTYGGYRGATFVQPEAIATAVIREVARLAKHGRVTLLIDGLEKTPEPQAREVFDALAALPDEASVVVVVPWHAAYGPRADSLVRPGEKLFALRPILVDRKEGAPGRAFMARLLERRLGLSPGVFSSLPYLQQEPAEQAEEAPPSEMRDLVDRAAEWSGGIPRIFLQLMVDAGTYARLNRDAAWPSMSDLNDAVKDMIDSFRRVLLPGDTHALATVDGTDGREMDLERKLRLLAHGALLERDEGERTTLRLHPLVRPLVGSQEAHG